MKRNWKRHMALKFWNTIIASSLEMKLSKSSKVSQCCLWLHGKFYDDLGGKTELRCPWSIWKSSTISCLAFMILRNIENQIPLSLWPVNTTARIIWKGPNRPILKLKSCQDCLSMGCKAMCFTWLALRIPICRLSFQDFGRFYRTLCTME